MSLSIVQLGTEHHHPSPFQKLLLETTVGHRDTVRRDEQVGAPIHRGHRVGQSQLHGPMLQQALSPALIQVSRLAGFRRLRGGGLPLSLIHISEPTRRTPISYAVFCLNTTFFLMTAY